MAARAERGVITRGNGSDVSSTKSPDLFVIPASRHHFENDFQFDGRAKWEARHAID
jgi:hypothetical protein